MDASDTTKKRKAMATYKNKLQVFVAKNPTGDCSLEGGTPCNTSTCIKTFESFDIKYVYYRGLNSCVNPINPVPENGGSR
jgi:hypothetical protein